MLCALVALVALAVPATAAAHGIGGIRDLPVPGWLFLVGGALVLLISFVALGALWTKPKLEVGAGRPLPEGLQRVLLSTYFRVIVSGLSFALFVVLWTAAAFGSERASANLAPTFIYIIFWVGMVVLTIVLRERLVRARPLARRRRRRRVGGRQARLVARAAPLSGVARPLARGAPPVLLRGARARVRGPGPTRG